MSVKQGKSGTSKFFSELRHELTDHRHATTRVGSAMLGFEGAVHMIQQVGAFNPDIPAAQWYFYGLGMVLGAVTYSTHRAKEERNALAKIAYPDQWATNLYNSVSQYAVTGISFLSGVAGVGAGIATHVPRQVMENMHLNKDYALLGATIGMGVPAVLMTAKVLSNFFNTDNEIEVAQAKRVIRYKEQNKLA